MRRFLLSLLTVSFIAGCGAMGVVTPQTTDQKIAAAYTTVTAIRRGALRALEGHSITVAQAKNIQQQADLARTGLDLATTMLADNPTGAQTQLELQLQVLNALQLYLESREGGMK